MDKDIERMNALFASPITDHLDAGITARELGDPDLFERLDVYQDEATGKVTVCAVVAFPIENYTDREVVEYRDWQRVERMFRKVYDAEVQDSGSDLYEVGFLATLPATATVEDAWKAVYEGTKLVDLHNALNGGFQARSIRADIAAALDGKKVG